MFKNRFNLRNVVAIAICLAGFSANSVLAQTTFNYTDASGVTCTYESYGDGFGHTFAKILKVTTLPASVTKWVIPEYVPFNNTQIAVTQFYNGGLQDLPNGNNTLREIVFPKYMAFIDAGFYLNTAPYAGGDVKFTSLRKITFGEAFDYVTQFCFGGQPLDSVIFKGDAVLSNTGNPGLFINCPATTKVIVPCGKLEAFKNDFTARTAWWQSSGITWTTANFYEAECLNTLTVLSSDVNLGNAISMSGGSILTITTPNSTSTTFSGTATLYVLPKANKVFTGWSDGNTDNPRTVTVSSDTTFTANFATCENVGIKSVNAESPLKVYPNPTNNTVYVELERFVNNGTLTLFDMSGKLVLSQSLNGNSAQINLSALTAGNYILRLVENGTASAGVQVIKQ
jgi:hypothetical protein